MFILGGSFGMPPVGMVTTARHMGQQNVSSSFWKMQSLDRHSMQKVCEHGRSSGVLKTLSVVIIVSKCQRHLPHRTLIHTNLIDQHPGL
ncbi:unnamed protein product [Ranitomeya imitator]|uniref:Uncharacterized protein n=1 Tax=Ranitomeya imitator TaxID=111125 RepID=A0ABN9MNY6_9NEOB|nr:unnamed protein product [Ranitomeya imitator]